MNLKLLRKAVSAMLALCLFAGGLAAQDKGFVLHEDFEGGIPKGWTQEKVKGDREWVKVSGSDGYDGGAYLSLSHEEIQTQGYVTRLVSPVMDVSGYTQPVVIFSYTLDKWAGDCDQLRVLYRESPELGDEGWVEVKTYDTYASRWTTDTANLYMKSETYQIAFEGTDRLGRGITIDNVIVRECPSCDAPSNVTAYDVDKTTATLMWGDGGQDAQAYRLRLNSKSLSEFELNDPDYKADVLDTVVTAGSSRYIYLENLEMGREYFVYIQTQCQAGNSPYSIETRFVTLNTEAIPFNFDFNYPESGVASRMENWYYGGSTDDMIPFVNTHSSETYRATYSEDKTTALIFGLADSWGGAYKMAAGVSAYAITPELTGQKLSDCQVVVTASSSMSLIPYGELIVGTVTDPKGDFEDVFTPVDTVYVQQEDGFKEFIVPLAGTPDDAKHVAFLSETGNANFICIDDLSIEKVPDYPKAHSIIPSFYTSDKMKLSWNSGGATEGEIYLSTEEVEENEFVKADIVQATEMPYTVDVMPATEYYVYVRNKFGGKYGEWSEPLHLVTPGLMNDLSAGAVRYDMEDGALPTGAVSLATSQSRAHVSVPNVNRPNSSNCLYVQAKDDMYFVFPQLRDAANTRVSFWDAGYQASTFVVGVIKDALDSTSFTAIDTIESEITVYHRRTYDLSKYADAGNYFAFKFTGKTGTLWIDDIEFKKIPTCKEPTEIDIKTTATSAVITWQPNGTSSWRVRVADADIYDSLYNANYASEKWIYDGEVTETTLTLNDLTPNETRYYVYFRPICSGEDTDWMNGVAFRTQCETTTIYPYTMDFNLYNSMGRGPHFEMPCWVMYESTDPTAYMSNRYPRLTMNSASANGYLSMRTDSLGSYAAIADSYVILPKFETDIKTLRLKMDVGNRGRDGQYFEVGVMTDPNDLTTFEAADKVSTARNLSGYTTVEIFFSKNTNGGQYIALYSPMKNIMNYDVDNIDVDLKEGCPKVKNLAAEDVTATSAKLSWTGDMETEWDLMITTAAVGASRLDEMFAAEDNDTVAFAERVGDNPYAVTTLFPNTYYYFYVRAVCGEDVNGIWSDAGTLRTECALLPIEQMKVEDFENYNSGAFPACWTVGNSLDDAGLKSNSRMPKVNGKGYNGANSLYFEVNRISGSNYDNGAYAISPELDVESVEDMRGIQVEFWGYGPDDETENKYKNQLRIGIVTDAEDPATIVQQEVISNFQEWYHYTIPFDRYEGDMNGEAGRYVMFSTDFPDMNNFYIDDVKFSRIPECHAPAHITTDSLMCDYARMVWTGASDAYIVKVAQKPIPYLSLNEEAGESDDIMVYTPTDTVQELTGLTKGATYYAYVGAVCGADTLWGNVFKFVTSCSDAYALPYTADFNDVTRTGGMAYPNCWTVFYGDEGTWYQETVMDADGHTGNSLNMYTGNLKYSSYAVMPKLVTSPEETLITFYAKKNSSNSQGNIVVGVVTDKTSRETMKNTFIPVDTVFITEDGWHKYYVSMGSYKGSDGYITFSNLFRYTLNSTGDMTQGYVLLDDVTADSLPSCMYPEYLTVTSVAPDSINVSFSELGDASVWEVACVPAGQGIDENSVYRSTATAYCIKGLQPVTDYDIYVRSVCGDDDHSRWTGPVSQRTATEAQTSFPYDEQFAVTGVWQTLGTTNGNSWYIGEAAIGDDVLYVSDDGGVSAKYDNTRESYSWAYRTLYLAPGVYTFDYEWLCMGERGKDFIRFGLLPSTAMISGGTDTVYYSDGTAQPLSGFIAIEGDNSGGLCGITGETWQKVSDYITVENDMVGYYHLVVYWQNDGQGGEQTSPSAAIRNIRVERTSCVQPMNLYVGRTTSSDADLSWEIIGTEADYTEWDVFVSGNTALASPDDAQEGDETYRNTVQSTYAVVEDLSQLSSYIAFVRAKCASDATWTGWSDGVIFTTPCDPVEVGKYVLDFEDNPTLNNIADCVDAGATKDVMASYNSKFQRIQNTGTYIYSREGEYAFVIKSTYGTSDGQYIALPHVKGSLDNVQLTFWMRPVPFRTSDECPQMSYGSLSGESGAMAVTVAAMSDLKDTATYTAIEECVYPYTDNDINRTTTLAEDITGNDWWVKFSVPLKGFDGQRILIHDAHAAQDDNGLYIDSIAIEEMPTCVAPKNVTLKEIGDRQATFTFESTNAAGEWEYRYDTDPKMPDAKRGSVNDMHEFTVSDLDPATTYYIAVRKVCSENDQSEWTLNTSFTTSYSVKFEERFSSDAMIPDGWDRASADIDEVFALQEYEFSYSARSDASGWMHRTLNSDASAHQAVKVEKDYERSRWLFSPVIYLPEGQKAYLRFDAALTLSDSFDPITDDAHKTGNQFTVAVSGDGGRTWLKENATVWNVGSGSAEVSSLYEFTNSFRTVNIDLSAFEGKNVRIGFYTKSGGVTDMDMHIDNVYVNSYETTEITDNVCENCDYEYEPEDILIGSDRMSLAGENLFEVYKESTDGGSDNLYRFKLTVIPMPYSEFSGTTCANVPYTGYGFIDVTSAGVHKRKIAAGGDGCDSVAVLNLSVTPLEVSSFDTTMCAGKSIVWNGKKYEEAGSFTDTVAAEDGGCDKVVTMNLYVTPSLEGEQTHYLCEGQSLEIDGEIFTSDGTFAQETVVETKSFEDGSCDSIITHTVVYAAKYDTVIEAAICDGETYSNNGFTVVAEDQYHADKVSPITGCDSLVTLNLLVIKPGETTRTIERKITTAQLPYDFYGKVFDADTEEGRYTGRMTVTSESGECSIDIDYTIIVGEAVEPGYESAHYAGGLILTPNPLKAGEELTVTVVLTDAERKGLVVDVFDATGMLVQRFTPDTESIVVTGFNTAGVYVIRLTDGNGGIHIGKVIVR